jgi:hypothetical protein
MDFDQKKNWTQNWIPSFIYMWNQNQNKYSFNLKKTQIREVYHKNK